MFNGLVTLCDNDYFFGVEYRLSSNKGGDKELYGAQYSVSDSIQNIVFLLFLCDFKQLIFLS